MNRDDLLKSMKKSIGNEEPTKFFEKMVDLFGLLFDRMDDLENEIHEVRTHATLAIKWDPQVARNMISQTIDTLRHDGKDERDFGLPNVFQNEITILKQAFFEDKVTKDYDTFCQFWIETLGYHPFLKYDK